MAKLSSTYSNFLRRRRRIRFGLKQKNPGKIRLSVHRSNNHIYAQIIDDAQGVTLACASTLEKNLGGAGKSVNTLDSAKKIGQLVAKRALDKGIKDVYFDRGGFAFHGKIKVLADAARETGLEF